MSEKRKPFDIYNLPYLRRKPRVKNPYPTLNRRMTAITLDSIMLLIFMPLIDWLAPVDMASLNAALPGENAQVPVGRLLMQISQNQRFIQSWVQNFSTQTGLFLLYSGVCWYFWSATPGKMIAQIKIVDAKTGGRMSLLQILLRLCGYIISCFTMMAGIFWIVTNKRRRAWHDYLADTVVVDAPIDYKAAWARLRKKTPPTPTVMPHETPAD